MIIKNKILLLIIICLVIAASIVLTYLFLLSPVDKNDGKDSLFEIKTGNSIGNIALDLKEQGLIRSVYAFKVYVRLNSLHYFQSGFYSLNSSMKTEDIVLKIQAGDVVYPDELKITFPEGLTLVEMAKILSKNINYSEEDIINAWNDPEFIEKVISDYTYITNDIKSSGISYPLNGYLFPETYFLASKDMTPKEVAQMMLDRMEEILNGFSYAIEDQDLTLHEILTLASIIEYEAKHNEDRPMISGVFHNRLRDHMKLESCATLEMALGVHKEVYTRNDFQVDSPYNTYYITGLPIGPGNCPSVESIEAAIKPSEHNYYFFLSDIYGDNKTYYSSTLSEHNKLKNKYLGNKVDSNQP